MAEDDESNGGVGKNKSKSYAPINEVVKKIAFGYAAKYYNKHPTALQHYTVLGSYPYYCKQCVEPEDWGSNPLAVRKYVQLTGKWPWEVSAGKQQGGIGISRINTTHLEPLEPTPGFYYRTQDPGYQQQQQQQQQPQQDENYDNDYYNNRDNDDDDDNEEAHEREEQQQEQEEEDDDDDEEEPLTSRRNTIEQEDDEEPDDDDRNSVSSVRIHDSASEEEEEEEEQPHRVYPEGYWETERARTIEEVRKQDAENIKRYLAKMTPDLEQYIDENFDEEEREEFDQAEGFENKYNVYRRIRNEKERAKASKAGLSIQPINPRRKPPFVSNAKLPSAVPQDPKKIEAALNTIREKRGFRAPLTEEESEKEEELDEETFAQLEKESEEEREAEEKKKKEEDKNFSKEREAEEKKKKEEDKNFSKAAKQFEKEQKKKDREDKNYNKAAERVEKQLEKKKKEEERRRKQRIQASKDMNNAGVKR